MVEKMLVFKFVCLEGTWPVYRRDKDGEFYFLVPHSTSYRFKEVILPELNEKYEAIVKDNTSR